MHIYVSTSLLHWTFIMHPGPPGRHMGSNFELWIHARLPEGGRAFVHGHTFLHSWSGMMTVVIGLLHGATFLSGLTLVLFVSFIRPWQLERILNKSLLIIIKLMTSVMVGCPIWGRHLVSTRFPKLARSWPCTPSYSKKCF